MKKLATVLMILMALGCSGGDFGQYGTDSGSISDSGDSFDTDTGRADAGDGGAGGDGSASGDADSDVDDTDTSTASGTEEDGGVDADSDVDGDSDADTATGTGGDVDSDSDTDTQDDEWLQGMIEYLCTFVMTCPEFGLYSYNTMDGCRNRIYSDTQGVCGENTMDLFECSHDLSADSFRELLVEHPELIDCRVSSMQTLGANLFECRTDIC